MIFRSFSNMKKQDDSVQTDQKNSEKCTVSHWNVKNALCERLGYLGNPCLRPCKVTKIRCPTQIAFVSLVACCQPLQFPIYDVGYHYPLDQEVLPLSISQGKVGQGKKSQGKVRFHLTSKPINLKWRRFYIFGYYLVHHAYSMNGSPYFTSQQLIVRHCSLPLYSTIITKSVTLGSFAHAKQGKK